MANTAFQELRKAIAKSRMPVVMTKSIPSIKRLRTGSLIFDSVVGGGLPSGMLTEIFGPPGSGKSTLAWMTIAENTIRTEKPKYCVYLNKEGRVDPLWLRSLGLPMVNTGNGNYEFAYYDEDGVLQPYADEDGEHYIQVMGAPTGEVTLELLKLLIGVADFVVVDSVAMLTPAAIAEQKLDKASKVGALSQLLTVAMQQIIPLMEGSNGKTTILLINQIRDNIGASAFGPKTHSPGGNSLHHGQALQIEFTGKKDLYVGDNLDDSVGMEFGAHLRKTSVCEPRARMFKILIARNGNDYEYDRVRELLTVGKRYGLFLDKDGNVKTSMVGKMYFRDRMLNAVLPLGSGEKQIAEALSQAEVYEELLAQVTEAVMSRKSLVSNGKSSTTEEESEHDNEDD